MHRRWFRGIRTSLIVVPFVKGSGPRWRRLAEGGLPVRRSQPSTLIVIAVVMTSFVSHAGDAHYPPVAEIANVEDLRPNFDIPAYYALLEHVQALQQPLRPADAESVDDWTDLADRPSAYRGRLVAVTGFVGGNKAHHYLGEHAHFGQVGQLELYHPAQPMSLTVICTTDVRDVPLHAEVTLAGYFLMLREYQTTTGKTRYGGLLIAQGPTVLATPQPLESTASRTLGFVVAAVAGGLVLGWVLIRRTIRGRAPRDLRTLHSTAMPTESRAADLAAWAAEQEPGDGPHVVEPDEAAEPSQ
jgi:hypothetical protein